MNKEQEDDKISGTQAHDRASADHKDHGDNNQQENNSAYAYDRMDDDEACDSAYATSYDTGFDTGRQAYANGYAEGHAE